MIHTTREAWLVAGIEMLSEIFAEQGQTLPPVRVSVGWPGGRGNKGNVIGQCWHPSASTDKIGQVFISPSLADPARILDVLTHELVHAVNHAQGATGHGADFGKIARSLGLTGKMTATVASEDLAATLSLAADALGSYPHAALSGSVNGADGPKTQGTRMLKVVCKSTDYTIRMTRKWLDEYGTPKCPCCDQSMTEVPTNTKETK